MKQKSLILLSLFLLTNLVLLGCGEDELERLTLSTTTSVYDSGLLCELISKFEAESDYDVEIMALGTGQALENGRRGDVDVLLVHALELEEEFLAEDYGTERFLIMHNDFVILGPTDDPANVKAQEDIEDVLQSIQDTALADGTSFISRGDDSGTHIKEMGLWDEYIDDFARGDWYRSLGQGMGDTLTIANEMHAYTIADRGTYLAREDNLANLEILFAANKDLFNPYSIIPVNPEIHNVNYEGAKALVEFMIREDIQDKISEYGKDEFGEPLFFPKAE